MDFAGFPECGVHFAQILHAELSSSGVVHAESSSNSCSSHPSLPVDSGLSLTIILSIPVMRPRHPWGRGVDGWRGPAQRLPLHAPVCGPARCRIARLLAYLKYMFTDSLKYTKKKLTSCGRSRGDGHGVTWLHATPATFLSSVPCSFRSMELPATTVGEWWRRHSL